MSRSRWGTRTLVSWPLDLEVDVHGNEGICAVGFSIPRGRRTDRNPKPAVMSSMLHAGGSQFGWCLACRFCSRVHGVGALELRSRTVESLEAR